MTILYASNQIEKLYEKWKDNLFLPSTAPFTKRLVVVPSLAMKRALQLMLAKDPEAGIGFGIKFIFIQNVFPTLLKERFYEDPLSLAFHIEKHMGATFKQSRELASLFIEYGKTAPKMLENFEGWQGELWKKIYTNKKYPYQYTLSQFEGGDVQIHLFALSFIPKLYTQFFLELAKQAPVFFYLLCPTEHYLGDLRTVKETSHFRDEEKEELFLYMQDVNPLLPSLGRINRKLQTLLEDVPREDHFVWQEGKTSLQRLQNELRSMENCPHQSVDDSLQFHIAPTKLSEVEVVYKLLLDLIAKGAGHLLPEEILVMAPSMNAYAPFVKAVFGRSDTRLDFQIMDLKVSSHQHLAGGFACLLELALGRFDRKTAEQVLCLDAFCKKHGITKEMKERICQWIKRASIEWGQNEGHKKEVFRRLYGQEMEASSQNTWSSGIHGLVEQFALEGGSTTLLEAIAPWISLLDALKKDLQPLESEEKKPLKAWSELLIELVEKYFAIEDMQEWEVLKATFERFGSVEIDEPFPFSSLVPHLKAFLEEERVVYNESKLSLVRFCSLLPMRAVPAKVVVLMGLHDEAFPRRYIPSSIDLRLGRKDVDFVPKPGDFDRCLFLEALLSARETFVMTLCKEEENEPSSIVRELLDYCPVKPLLHPLEGFLEGAKYSKSAERQALLFLKENKQEMPGPIENFSVSVEEALPSRLIDIHDLTLAFTRPLQLYINNALKFRLPQEDEEKDFVHLSPLLLYQVKQAFLRHPLPHIIDRLCKRGLLAEGKLRALQLQKIESEIAKLEEGLRALEVDRSVIQQIVLRKTCKSPYAFKGGMILPPICLSYKGEEIRIVGKLEVCPKGIISLRKDLFKESLKEFPKVLLAHFLDSGHDLLFASSASIKPAFVQDAEKALHHLLDHYFYCMKAPCPLIPEWVEEIMMKEEEKLLGKIKTSLGERQGSSFDPYLRWTFEKTPCPKMLIRTFQPLTQLFFSIKEGWYP